MPSLLSFVKLTNYNISIKYYNYDQDNNSNSLGTFYKYKGEIHMKKLTNYQSSDSVTTASTMPTKFANEHIFNAPKETNKTNSKPRSNNSPIKKSPSYVQDTILKDIIGEQKTVTMILMNGFQMNGKIVSFDQYVINFKTSNGNTNMVFKHAISTIMIS